MDLDRFKKKRPTQAPPKRSVNGGEKVSFNNPTIVSPNQKNTSVTNHSINRTDETINIFDEDDIFGVWNKQKQIKRQLKLEEQAKKAAKKAAKKQKKLAKQQAKVERKASGAPRKLELSVTVPNSKQSRQFVKKIQNRINYQPSQRKYYITGGILVVLPLLLVGFSVLRQTPHSDNKPAVQGASKDVAAKPDFATIKATTPDNQATSIRYDTQKKVASYNDVLKDVPITVSQQPLPSGFQSDPTGKVAELAKQINANDKISTSDTTAYAGLSIKGPQTVVFTKNDLLIFIYADKQLDVLTWEKYIESMQTR